MFVTESRAQLGFLPLQHEDFEKETGLGRLDQRSALFGLRIFEHQTGPEDRGTYLFQEESVGDVIGSFLWENTTRRIPGWRLGAWPTKSIQAHPTSAQDPVPRGLVLQEGDAPTPAAFGRTVPFLGQPEKPPVGDEQNVHEELFLPILNADFDPDNRFIAKRFSKPRIEVKGFLDPNTRTSPRVKIGIDAWQKFPVGWHGIALAADEEIRQEELFLPADPRLVVVNQEEADPDLGTRVVEVTSENKVDGLRMGRLHSAFRVLRGPATFCDKLTTAKYEEKVDVGIMCWNIHESGASDRLPGGLVIAPPSARSEETDNVVAAISSTRGGPIDVGSDMDRHRIGSVDGLSINQAHISGNALYRFGPRGIHDAPILHNGLAVIGSRALPNEIDRLEGEPGSIIDVFFVFDPTIPHVDFCGRTVPGHHRWFAVIPDEESARPAKPQTGHLFPFNPPPKMPPPPPEVGFIDDVELGRPPPPPLPPPSEAEIRAVREGGEPPGFQVQFGGAERQEQRTAVVPPDPDPPPLMPPPESCPKEGSPQDTEEGPEEASPDGACTSGPLTTKPPPEIWTERPGAFTKDVDGRLIQIAQFDTTTGSGGPQYRQGSLDIFQLLTLSEEGHELHREDREDIKRWQSSVQTQFINAPYSDRREETFLDTARARGMAHLFFRASWLGDRAPNFPQWTGRQPGGGRRGPTRKAREMRQSLQPVVARQEAWGNQTDTILGFDYTDNLFRSRYFSLGTSTGGLAILPPETSIDDIRRGVERTDESQITFLLADRVDFAVGADPEISDGSTRNGWIWRERQATDAFSLMRGRAATAPADADSVMRLDQSDNLLLDFGQGDADPAGGSGVLAMRDRGTPPSLTPANGVVFFSALGVPFVRDGAGVDREIGGAPGVPPQNTVTVFGDFTATAANDVILVDASGTVGDITITLPENTTAADLDGKRFTIKKIDSSASDVLIEGTNRQTAGSNLIDGAFTLTITAEDQAFEVTSDGDAWHITAEHDPSAILRTVRTFVATTGVAGTTITDTDDVVLVDAAAIASSATLPDAATRNGRRFTVKKVDSSINVVLLLPIGGDTIDGEAAIVIFNQNDSFTIVSDGMDWHILSEPVALRDARTITLDTTLDRNIHEVVLVDASGGPVTVTLPDAIGGLDGLRFTVKKIDSSDNAVTIDSLNQTTAGDSLIDGEFTQTLSGENDFIEATQDPTAWRITAESRTQLTIDPVPTWHRFIVVNSDFSNTSGIEDFELFSLPAGGIIHAVKIYHGTSFSGGSASFVDLSVGIAADLTRYQPRHNVRQAPGDQIFALTHSFGSENHNAATSIRIQAISDAPLGDLTAGEAEIFVLLSRAF